MYSKRILHKYLKRKTSYKTTIRLIRQSNIKSIHRKQLNLKKLEYDSEKQYVLSPMSLIDLQEYFDEKAIKVIQFYLRKAWYSQPELIPGQKDIPFQAPKEHIEQWAVQALGVEPSGAGSYPVDIIKAGIWGADVKGLKCKALKNGSFGAGTSGETSLAQKFKVEKDLDDLFNAGAYDEIILTYGSIIKLKLNQAKREKKLKNIFYFFLLNKLDDFYLCGLRVYINGLDHIKPLRHTNKAVWADKFIAADLGEMKVYKSKKRFELRLRPRGWADRGLLLKLDLPFEPYSYSLNMRDVVAKKGSVSAHIDKLNKRYHSF